MNDLHGITDTILGNSSSSIERLEALSALKNILLGLTGLEMGDYNLRNNISTDAGLAIGTEWAARCLDDYLRSVRFMRGVNQAIKERLALAPDRPVELLYAGTGPFASLVFPLLSQFRPEQLRLTLVEINEQSVGALRKLFALPQYRGFVRQILHADCTKLELSDWGAIDILLTETMQCALQREQQVPITEYLMPRLREDAILIPREIKVGLGAFAQTEGPEGWKLEMLSPLITLSRAGLTSSITADGKAGSAQNSHSLALPARAEVRGILAFITDIHIHGNEHLGFNECGLTVAKRISPGDGGSEDRVFTWYYGYTPEPGIVWKITNNQ